MPPLTFLNVDSFCSQIDLAEDRPLINLSDITFVEPFSLIYLGLFIRYHNSRGKYFRWKVPESAKARGYFARMRFYDHFNFDPKVIEGEKRFRFTTSTSFNDMIEIEKDPYVAEDVADKLRELLVRESVRVDVLAVCEAIAEVVDNFSQHAETQLAAMTVQWFPRINMLRVAVGDCGVGIRNSLSQNPDYRYLLRRKDGEAIAKAFEPLVSRNPEGGMGLNDLRDLVIRLRGSLHLSSGQGFLVIRRGSTFIGDMHLNLAGVQLEVGFPERG